MKKLLTILTGIIVLFSVLPIFSATASRTIDVQLLIPKRVGIRINNTGALVFDLTSVTLPTTFPGYYFPTSAETEVLMDIFCNAAAGYTLDVVASGDFSTDVPVSQLYFAPTGTAKTSDGTATPAAPWTAYSTASVNVETGPRLTGWVTKNQAVEFKWEDTDPEVDPSSTVTLTYTITSL